MFARSFLALTLGVALSLSACDSVDESSDELTPAEVADVTQIIAEAVAESSGGLFASAALATSTVTEDGLEATGSTVRGFADGRDPVCGSGATVNYDAETGTHRVFFGCAVDTEFAQRDYEANLFYQFRDADGGFVADPAADQGAVASVDFTGEADGTTFFARGGIQTAATFAQSGEWDIVGLDTDAASFTVRQERSGTTRRITGDAETARAYDLDIAGDDIRIAAGPGGQGRSAVGQLDVELTVEVTRRGRTQDRRVEGTIDLGENGGAMLRLFGVETLYALSLGDGTVTAQ